MARATQTPSTRPATTKSSPAAAPATSSGRTRPAVKSPLDRLYGRIKLSAKYLMRTAEEAALFQAREPVDSQSRPMLANLASILDLQKKLTEAETICEKLGKTGWAPKGALVKAKFAVGDAVTIATEKQGHYLRHGLYDAEQIAAEAKVVRIAGAQASIKLEDGSVIAPISAAWLRKVAE